MLHTHFISFTTQYWQWRWLFNTTTLSSLLTVYQQEQVVAYCKELKFQKDKKKSVIIPSCPEPMKLIHAQSSSFKHLYICSYTTVTQIQDPH